MELQQLHVGDIVQLNPGTVRNKMFASCFMVISELPKDWGCQGYVQSLGQNGEIGAQAYYRAKWDEMEFVGKAQWYIE
jgi:hypothetical protein